MTLGLHNEKKEKEPERENLGLSWPKAHSRDYTKTKGVKIPLAVVVPCLLQARWQAQKMISRKWTSTFLKKSNGNRATKLGVVTGCLSGPLLQT